MAGEQDRLLFQYIQGEPTGFYLHPSIKNASRRANLINSIVANGGKVLDQPRGADTVLVDERNLTSTIKDLQNSYSISRDAAVRKVVVEPMKYVQNCLRRQQFGHDIKKQQAMGGYIGRRTKFTEEDDDNLCWYISRKIPYAENGGRFSTGIWKELMSAAECDESLKWAKRHTTQSWRERYKKNYRRLDPIIAEYAEKEPPEPTAVYRLSRKSNKRPWRALRAVEPRHIVELTTSESEQELAADLRPRRLGQIVRDSQRREGVSSSESSPASVTMHKKMTHASPAMTARSGIASGNTSKGKAAGQTSRESDKDQRIPFNFSPAPAPFDPNAFQSRQLSSSPMAVRQEGVHSLGAPSPTLVQRPSSAPGPPPPPIPTLPITRGINLASPLSTRPSTSFRNVVHSSPVFNGAVSPSKSGVRSHDTSATEPSSRSLIPIPLVNVPSALPESSITRESSHKPSSPIPQPMKKASRKLPSRQPPTFSSSSSDEWESQLQETQWAPYKNTRSRSKSVERALSQSKKKGKQRQGKGVSRNRRLLEPVHENDVEQEQKIELDNKQSISTGTETFQDRQEVEQLLMVNLETDTMPVTTVDISRGQVEGERRGASENEDETGGEGEGSQRPVHEREKGETEETHRSVGDVSAERKTLKSETTHNPVAHIYESESETEENDVHDISSFSESDGSEGRAPSLEVEDRTLDISEDDEATAKRFLPESHPLKRRRLHLSSDDDIDRIIKSSNSAHASPTKTAREVLYLFGSSPEIAKLEPQQHLQLHDKSSTNYSALSLQSRQVPGPSIPPTRPTLSEHERPSTSLLTSRELVETPMNRKGPKIPRSHRAPFSGDSDLFSPSSIDSLSPKTFALNTLRVQLERGEPQTQSPLRRSVPLSRSRSRSQVGQGVRHESAESTSSELIAFPIIGTRASAVKRKAEQNLKDSQYMPLSGTKAAQIVGAGRRLRPRKRP